MNPLLKECHIQIACDVNNPLCGENGSTYVYGPQKGVTEDMKKTLDEAMAHFARVTSETLVGVLIDRFGKEVPVLPVDLAMHSLHIPAQH